MGLCPLSHHLAINWVTHTAYTPYPSTKTFLCILPLPLTYLIVVMCLYSINRLIRLLSLLHTLDVTPLFHHLKGNAFSWCFLGQTLHLGGFWIG